MSKVKVKIDDKEYDPCELAVLMMATPNDDGVFVQVVMEGTASINILGGLIATFLDEIKNRVGPEKFVEVLRATHEIQATGGIKDVKQNEDNS